MLNILCEKLEVDYENVRRGMAADFRIGDSHLDVNHGGYRGFGGYCFPKDLDALISFLKDLGEDEGVKLLEYNARFGDPETMNILPIMETDFVEVCDAIINQKLNKIKIKFQNKATVCKYIVPEGYPDNPVKNVKIEINPKQIPKDARLYYASVDQKNDGLYSTSSRAVGCLGIADNLEKAERIAEEATKSVKGKVFHREDIGTKKLIEKRINHMKDILSK